MKSLSVVIPVYHNAPSLHALHQRISAVIAGLDLDSAEVVYVDDGSRDDSYARLRELAAADARVRVVKLSRNFGSTSAILAGLAHAQGDCAAVISADLQDPPEMIHEMVEAHEEGAEVVLAARRSREDPWLTSLFSKTFYALFRRFALRSMPAGGFDCFLLSQRAYRLLVSITKPHTYLMGQILWLGFPRRVIEYDRQRRAEGRSMWTISKKLTYFIDSFVSFSYAPLRASSLLGFLVACCGFLYAAAVILLRVIYGFPVEGWSSLMVVTLLLGGTQLLVLGVLGEYLWRSLDASRDRPPFVVETLIEPGTIRAAEAEEPATVLAGPWTTR